LSLLLFDQIALGLADALRVLDELPAAILAPVILSSIMGMPIVLNLR
jgi:hypothetical protein